MNKISFWLIGIVAVVLVAFGVYHYANQSAPALSANDQVFAEVSEQFSFTREQVKYFTIYGTDRVQYNVGQGLTFAYKSGGVWQISGPVGAQEVPACSLLSQVPEKYRQACWDEPTKQNLYVDPVDSQNINYPTREAVRYIQSSGV